MNNDSVYFKFKDRLLVNFILEDMILKNINLKLTFRLDNPGLILATFKCQKEQYSDFGKFVNKNNNFRIESNKINNYVYYSDNVSFIQFEDTYGERDFEGTVELSNYYYRFYFEEEKTDYKFFDERERFLKPVDGNRSIEFQLLKPYEIWHRTFIHEIMKNDKEFIDKVNQRNKFILTNLEFSYYVKEIRYKTNSDTEFYEVCKKRVFVKISEVEKSNLCDDKFKENILHLFEDLLLLISFASSRNIDWMIYNFSGDKYSIWFLKSLHDSSNVNSEKSDLIIETHYLNEFLINSYKNLTDLKNNFNLIVPIREYLAHSSAIYLEQQFLIVFIAFEKLCNDYSDWKFGNLEILDKSRFEKVRKELKSFLKDNSKFSFEDEELDKIKEKLDELNRTSIKRKLITLFSHFEIEYEKALDENGNFKFIRIRNKNIHSVNDNDSDLLYDEYERVKKFFELIVLKLLDGNSLSHLHPDFKFRWERTFEN